MKRYSPRILLSLLSLICAGILSAQTSLRYNWYEQFSDKYPDSCIQLFERDTSLRSHVGSVEFDYIYARAYQNKGDYDSSEVLVNKQLKNFPSDGDSLFYFKLLLLNAENYRIGKQYHSALDLLRRSQEYYLRRNDTSALIENSIRITEFYRTMGNISAAKKTAGNCISLINQHSKNSELYRAKIYNRVAAIFVQEHGNIDSAIVLSKQVIRISHKYRDLDLEASSCGELAFIYQSTGNDSALFYYDRAMEIYTQLNYDRYLASVINNVVRYHMQHENYDQALEWINQSVDMSIENNWESMIAEGKELKASILYMLGKPDVAFVLLEEAAQTNYRLLEKKYSDELLNIQSQVELTEANRIIAEQELKLQQAQSVSKLEILEKDRLYILFFSTIFVLMVVAIFLYRISKSNRALKRSRQLLEDSNKELEKAIEQKESALGQREVLLQEVHHRVKNNLSVLSSMLYLQRKSLKSKAAIEALSNSQNRISTIALIHESLYQRNDMTHVNFQDYLEKLCLSIKDSFGPDSESVVVRINCHELQLELDRSIPLAMIINELLTNSFKHAFSDVKNPIVGVVYDKKRSFLKVYDNGKGKVSKKKTSLGLKLIDIFSQQIESDIETLIEGEYLVNYINFKTS